MVATYLADPEVARAIMGHPTDGTNDTPAEITIDDMNEILESAHDQLVLFTRKSDWTPDSPVINNLKMIECLFASSIGRGIWRDPDNKAQEHFNRAKSMCQAIIENQETADPSPPTAASQTSVAYTYNTNALNESATRYKSPRVDV